MVDDSSPHKAGSSTAKRDAPARRPYKRPSLTVFGKVVTMTGSAGGSIVDPPDFLTGATIMGDMGMDKDGGTGM